MCNRNRIRCPSARHKKVETKDRTQNRFSINYNLHVLAHCEKNSPIYPLAFLCWNCTAYTGMYPPISTTAAHAAPKTAVRPLV